MKLLVKNIGILAGIDHHGFLRLQGTEMASFNQFTDAWLYVEDGIFVSMGTMEHCPAASEQCFLHGATHIRISSMPEAESMSLLTRFKG